MILEEKKLNIYDEHCKKIQELNGKFHGVTEGKNGDIFTLCGLDVLKFSKINGFLVKVGQIFLKVLKDFERWYSLSKPRNVVYSITTDSLHITDLGLHKIVTLNLETGCQNVVGYFGEGSGQLKNPSAMIVDDVGNLMVIDQGNRRLVVYNSSGRMVKEIVPDNMVKSAIFTGLHLKDDEVVAVFTVDGEGGGIMRYRL